jgi:hypothetical protein
MSLPGEGRRYWIVQLSEKDPFYFSFLYTVDVHTAAGLFHCGGWFSMTVACKNCGTTAICRRKLPVKNGPEVWVLLVFCHGSQLTGH